MMKLLILTLLLSTQSYAFTLNNNFGAAFGKDRVRVRIAGNSTCNLVGNVYEIEDLLKPAVNNFWNEVPTSRLRLRSGGFTDPINNINTGYLCAPTDDECITKAGAGNLIPPVNDIVVACNRNPDNFNDPSVLAVTVPNHFSGNKIKGAVILLNDSSAAFSGLSRSDKISVLAHEIGHAIGLGHAENKHKEALMYYRTVNLRKNLSQDDVDGVSYLYPKQVDACGLLGLTDMDRKNPPFWQMGVTLFMFVLLMELRRLLKRSKARAST